MHIMKYFPSLVLLAIAASAAAACGEDRSGEQPFAPTVQSVGVEVKQHTAVLTGAVLASPNSSLKECGFAYGNDTLRAKCTAAEPAATFTAETDSLGAGHYYAVPYASNGVGTTYADTLYFDIAG
ncbi:MAG: hypothetical protein MR516_01935 [Bacteroidales bacterium]|nr:hypothetical protein [Bacteroidales bacterium]